MIELALRVKLLSVSAITDIVGQRIYIDLSPQSADLPRIVLRLVPGARREYHSTSATDLVFADVEATLQAATYVECGTLYDALRDAIDFVRQTWDGTSVDCAKVTPPYGKLNLPQHGDEQGISSLVTTIETAFREA